MMMLSQAAQATGGKLVGPDVSINGVSSDSRKLALGNLFIALRGEHFDGYEFAAQVVRSGAAAVMVNADSYKANPSLIDPRSSCLIVEDTRLALGQLAKWWRRQFAIPLVAITGSNGKTTVKEMLSSVLREAGGSANAVLATIGNLNNDIGMPLTLLRLNAGHRYAVIEMGMNHPGEIDYLTRIAAPDIALINNASGAHLEGLGSVQAVAQAKGEILAGLENHGTAVINADDEHAPLWRGLAGAHPLLEFGLDQQADVHGTWQPKDFGLQLNVQTPQGDFTAVLHVPGEHNARNALAATTAAIALNIPLEKIVAGLEKFRGVVGRLQRKAALHGASMIDDTYNANPASMRAAIGVLAQAAGKHILVLGDMGELGDDAAAFHAEIGTEARRAGIEKMFALGELSRNAVREFGSGARHFERIEDLQSELEKELDANTTILVKGSRFMKMERVVSHCVDTEKGEGRREMGGTGTGSSPSPFPLPPSQAKEVH
jgi:UDP-N-acetylmuramoyl-tripeptide--D-alanyl-D-alanine ligase